MKKLNLVFLSIFVFGTIYALTKFYSPTLAQEESLIWTEYEYTPSINDIAVGTDYIWGVHTDGLIRWHKQDHTYTHFNQENGLIGSMVTAVEIDNNDNVWVGTTSGLSRFNGIDWTHFTSEDGLANNIVLSLSLAPNGDLLVGHQAGLSIYDGTNWTQFTHDSVTDPGYCLSRSIIDMEIDSNGYIWISTDSAPICYFDGTTWDTFYINGESVSSKQIEFDENGDLWIAAYYFQNENGVIVYKTDGTWVRYTQSDGLIDDEVSSVTIAENGDVWVGIEGEWGSGVNRFDGTAWSSYAAGYYGSWVSAVEVDQDGATWTGGASNVSRLFNDTWQAYLTGPPRGFAYDIMFDHEDHLWAGIYRNGAVEFDGQRWNHYMMGNGLPGDHVVDILEDNDGNMWFATYEEQWDLMGRGITQYDGNNWTTFTVEDGLASNNIEDMGLDNEGNLWVGHRYDAGIDKETASGWVNYTTADGLLSDRIRSIYTNGQIIWVGHPDSYTSTPGISSFNGTNWNSFSDELAFPYIRNFATNLDGELLALGSDGTNIFNGNSWDGIPFPDPNDYVEQSPYSYIFSGSDMVVDNQGNWWIVGNQGLFMYDGQNWSFFYEENTPVSGLSSQIAINSIGNEIWINSQNGLVKLEVVNTDWDRIITGLTAENNGPTTINNSTTLTATVTNGSNINYSWDFGDGTTGTGTPIQHTYENIGVYTAIVTATNSVSELVTNTQVTITEQTDEIINGLSISSNPPFEINEPVYLTATVTSGTNIDYYWSFGDDVIGTGEFVNHTYSNPGLYTVIVTATNSVSEEVKSAQIIVDEPILGLDLISNSSVNINEMASFTATIQSGSNVHYSWEFSDGLTFDGVNITRSFSEPGIYTATLTAENSVSIATDNAEITVKEGYFVFLPAIVR